MLAAVFRGPGELEVTELPTPEAGPGEVLVEIGANTVCGTDVRILRGEKTRGISRDFVLGHELSGRVAEVGKGVEGCEVGDSVVVAPVIYCLRCHYCKRGKENLCLNKRIFGNVLDGGLAEYMRVPAEGVEAGNIFVASREVPPEHLALAEPLACCVNGLKNYRVEMDDTVLILGAGPIGLFHLQLALLSGARQVIVSNPSEDRREFAKDLGASVVVDPTSEDLSEVVSGHTDGLGVDVVVICIGIPNLVNDALRMVRKGGRVNVFAGLSGAGWSEVEANLIHYNEISLSGASDSKRENYDTALRLIESGKIAVEKMVTHRYPLSETVAAIDKSASGEGIKVAVTPKMERA